MKELPKFYNNLDLTLEEIKGLLSRGVKDRKSGFHNFVMCNLIENTTRCKNSSFKRF